MKPNFVPSAQVSQTLSCGAIRRWLKPAIVSPRPVSSVSTVTRPSYVQDGEAQSGTGHVAPKITA